MSLLRNTQRRVDEFNVVTMVTGSVVREGQWLMLLPPCRRKCSLLSVGQSLRAAWVATMGPYLPSEFQLLIISL